MIKCPNCGSTAQLRPSTPMYYENGVWKQQNKCGCGCVIILRYTEEIEELHLRFTEKIEDVILPEPKDKK